MKRPSITIRMSGNENTVQVDNKTFDRSRMSKDESAQLTRMVVAAHPHLYPGAK